MKLITTFFLVFFCAILSAQGFSATQAPSSPTTTTEAVKAPTVAAKPPVPVATAPGNLLQIILSLVLVVGLLIVLSVAFKKFGLDRIQGNFPIKIIGGIGIGTNQRIMVIEAGDEWVVLGVTPHSITPLTNMARQETGNANATPNPKFSTWMQSTLEKYRVEKK